MHYYHADGRAVLDGTAGLWCCNAGHNRDPIVRGDPAPGGGARLSRRRSSSRIRRRSSWRAASPTWRRRGLDHVFFCNSGSEAADTALKIALAYHNVSGQGARTRLIGRERGYHGVGFGGIVGRRHRQQPQVFRHPARRRRSPAAHLQPRAAGLHQGRARMGRASRRRAGAASSRCTMPRPSRR